MYMWYYVILLFYDALWCPMYFCMISWFYTVDAGLTQTTRNRVKSLTSPAGGSRIFMPWRIRLMATRCVLKSWVHGYHRGFHLGLSFVRFRPYEKKKQIHMIPIRVIHFSLGKKPRSPEEYGQAGGFSLKADLQKVFAQRPTRHLLPPLWRSGRFVWGHPAVFVPTPCAWTRNAHCDALSFSSGWDQFDPTKISQSPSDQLT